MTSLYLDTSAILKRYLDEEFSQQCEEIIAEYSDIYLSQVGVTETLINLRKRLSTQEFAIASKLFEDDIATFNIIVFDRKLSYSAVEISQGLLRIPTEDWQPPRLRRYSRFNRRADLLPQRSFHRPLNVATII